MSNQWPNQRVTGLRQSLRNLKLRLDHAVEIEETAISEELARYLVIRSCGYLEQIAIICCQCYVLRHSNDQVSSYAISWIQRASGSIPEMLIKLMERLDTVWRLDLESFLKEKDEYRWTELKYLVDRRNRIAHGLNESVTPRKATELYEVSLDVADWFINNSKLAS